jgi:hypothetical protein
MRLLVLRFLWSQHANWKLECTLFHPQKTVISHNHCFAFIFFWPTHVLLKRDYKRVLRSFVDSQMTDCQIVNIQMSDCQIVDIQMTDCQIVDIQMSDCQIVDIQITDHQIVNIQIVNTKIQTLLTNYPTQTLSWT